MKSLAFKEELCDLHYYNNMVGVTGENAEVNYDVLNQFGNLGTGTKMVWQRACPQMEDL